MRSNQLPIDSPCHESWEAMDGDAERRFCGVCQKHVHNLSAMRHDDARALLAESAGTNLCVRYSAETDGSLRFRDLVPAARLTRGLVRSAFAAVLLAACDPGQSAPIADLGESVIESIREATTPTNDGGCNYTTGPFTTFHFAPGHVRVSQQRPPRRRPTARDQPSTPPREPTLDPIALPTHRAAVPMPDPIDMPLMGQAVAFPEPTQPFVPCDPKPTSHRPPQPQFAPPPPPTYERMGDVAAPIEPPPAMGGLAVFEPPPPPPHPGFAPPPPHPGFAPPPPPHAPAPPRLRPRTPA